VVSTTASSPADKVQAVADRLASSVVRYDAARDHRAPFAFTYWRLTTALAEGLAAGVPAFDDPDWVADLSVSLASEYFTAMDEIDRWRSSSPRRRRVAPDDLPGTVPQPWRDVYAASSAPRSYVLEDVLFSMSAHISYDLPVTLRRLADQGDVRPRIADFHRMNDLLASSIDHIQDELAARYWRALASLDRLFTKQDELLTDYGVRTARGMAWYNLERLSDPAAAPSAALSIQRSTGGFIRQVREPEDPKLRLAARLGRWLIPARRRWPAVRGTAGPRSGPAASWTREG
jgi:hypothetical protein